MRRAALLAPLFAHQVWLAADTAGNAQLAFVTDGIFQVPSSSDGGFSRGQ